MQDQKGASSEQHRHDMAPAASPLGTNEDVAANRPSAERVEMVRKAEERIDAAAKRRADDTADHEAHVQRGSSTGYGKEEHMNGELAKQKAQEQVEEDPSGQPS